MNQKEKIGLFLWVVSAIEYFETDDITTMILTLIFCVVGFVIFTFSGDKGK